MPGGWSPTPRAEQRAWVPARTPCDKRRRQGCIHRCSAPQTRRLCTAPAQSSLRTAARAGRCLRCADPRWHTQPDGSGHLPSPGYSPGRCRGAPALPCAWPPRPQTPGAAWRRHPLPAPGRDGFPATAPAGCHLDFPAPHTRCCWPPPRPARPPDRWRG